MRALKIFSEIAVPASVFEEITVAGKPDDAEIKALSNLRIIQLDNADIEESSTLDSMNPLFWPAFM